MSNRQVLTPKVIHFSQWSRKGYSLFKVLGRVVKISFLMVAYLLVAEPAEAQKELSRINSGEEADLTLEEVEVIGQRISSSLADLARVVQVITKKEIAKSPYSSIHDLLDQELSLDIRQRGHEGIQADISIQGSTYEQVLVLLNGIPLNNPQTGHFNGDIPVPLQAVERIEVIEGGASRWLGPNAFAGAINVITSTDLKKNIQLKIAGGQHELLDAELTMRTGNRYKQMISLSHIQTSGYAKNTDLKSTKLFYQGSGSFSKFIMHVQAGAGLKKFGAYAFYTPLYPDQYEEIEHGFASVGLKKNGKISVSHDVYLRIHADEFHLFRNESPSWYTAPNRHRSMSYGIINNVWWNNKLGRITWGLDYKADGIVSTVLGNDIDENRSLPFSNFEYSKQANRQYISLYGEQIYKFNKSMLVFGVMSNAIISDSLYFRLFPGIDYKYKLTPLSHIYISANKSMRMPSFTELYYTSPTNQGNPELKPEEAWSAQSGYKWNTSKIILDANIFASYGKNLIDWSLAPNDEKWTTRNINNLLRAGAEAEMRWKPFSSHRWSETQILIGYRYVSLSQSSIEVDSKYLLDHLRHKLIVSFQLPLTNNLHLGIQTNIQDRAGWYTDWTESGESYQQDFQPFTITNLSLQYKMKKITVFSNILNLWDVQYADIGHVEQAGRWIRFGLKMTISD